jgi:hypothetical protein
MALSYYTCANADDGEAILKELNGSAFATFLYHGKARLQTEEWGEHAELIVKHIPN